MPVPTALRLPYLIASGKLKLDLNLVGRSVSGPDWGEGIAVSFNGGTTGLPVRINNGSNLDDSLSDSDSDSDSKAIDGGSVRGGGNR
jgi:hypothetical protein